MPNNPISNSTFFLETNANSKPEIDATHKQLDELISKARDAMRLFNDRPDGPSFFRHDGGLVRLETQPSLRVVPITSRSIAGNLSECADFFKEDKDGNSVPAMPTHEVCTDIVARPDPALPELKGIRAMPFYLREGEKLRLVTGRGYYREAGLYLCLPDGFVLPTIPDSPSTKDIQWALGYLSALIDDFPFKTVSDRANTFAFLLLPFVRSLIAGPTPLHAINSPVPQTGKTLLAILPTLISLGIKPLLLSLQLGSGYAESEAERKLFATLRLVPSFVLIDNLGSVLDSATLAALLTSVNYTGRVIGSSQSPTIRNHAIWMLTAINLATSPEMARRIVPIFLDAQRESLDGRTFRYPNLEQTILENRATICAAALILIQSWVAQGTPRAALSFDSFSEYAQLLGGILQVAGVPGFLENRSELRTRVPERDEFGALVTAWYRAHGSNWVHAKDLLDLIRTCKLPASFLGSGADPLQRAAIGRYVGAKRDMIINGLRVVVENDSHSGAKHYRLEPVATVPAGDAGEQGGVTPSS